MKRFTMNQQTRELISAENHSLTITAIVEETGSCRLLIIIIINIIIIIIDRFYIALFSALEQANCARM